MMTYLFILFLATLSTWATVETLHHSLLGGIIWRQFAIRLSYVRGCELLAKGMACPYCFGVWFGIFYATILVLQLSEDSWSLRIILSFMLGISAARLAQFLNDLFRLKCRTPNENKQAATWLVYRETLTEKEQVKEDNEPSVEEKLAGRKIKR